VSHRTIIFNALKATLEEPEVRAEFTTHQLAKIDQICAHTEPCDNDFRYLTRMQNKAYCEED
jgi:hypothetical protein